MTGPDGLLAGVDAVLFDLDGTLADTFDDIRDAVNHVRAGRGLPPLDLETVMSHVGRGVSSLVRGALGSADDAAAREDLRAFRERYTGHLLDRTRAYPGAVDAVASLAGRRRAVLSNKPEAMTRAIVQGLGLAAHLDGAWGGDSFPAMKPDAGAILSALERLETGPARALMVGDSDVDIGAARAAGVRAVRVRTGLWRSSSMTPDLEVGDLRELAERLDSAPR